MPLSIHQILKRKMENVRTLTAIITRWQRSICPDYHMRIRNVRYNTYVNKLDAVIGDIIYLKRQLRGSY